MANLKKNDTPAKALLPKPEKKPVPRKRPTLKEKQAKAKPASLTAGPTGSLGEEVMIDAAPDTSFALPETLRPRLSGRQYAALRHAEHLAKPGLVSVRACDRKHTVKGRSKRGWTTPKEKA